MKKIMKKVMSLALVVMMVLTLAPMTAYAAQLPPAPSGSGTMDDPYIISADGTAYTISFAEAGAAYVQVDAMGATITGESTVAEFTFREGKGTPVESVERRAEITLNSNMLSVISGYEGANNVIIMATGGEIVDTTGTMDNPEVLDVSYGYAEIAKQFEGGESMPYFATVTAPTDGRIEIYGNAIDNEMDWNPVGWSCSVQYGAYNSGNVTGSSWEVVEILEVEAGDVIDIVSMTYAQGSFTAVPGIMKTEVYFYPVGSYTNPVNVQAGTHTSTLEAATYGYYYEWIAEESGDLTVTMDSNACANGWQYQLENITKEEGYAPHDHTEDPIVESQTITVTEGDVIYICINTYDPTDESGEAPAGEVKWSLSFVKGEGQPSQPEEPEVGTNENPYQVMSGDVRPVGVYLPVGGHAFVQSNNENGVVDFLSETSADWHISYGAGTEITPTVDGTDITATLQLNGYGKFILVNDGTEPVTVYVKVSEGAPSGSTTGTMNDPEVLEFEELSGGIVGTSIQQEVAAGSEGYFYQWTATADGKVTFTMLGAVDSQGRDFGWLYCFSNVTGGKYGDTIWSDSDPVVTTITYNVTEGDIIKLNVAPYDASDEFAKPAGTVFGTLVFEEKEDVNAGPTKEYVTPESGSGTDEAPYVIKNLGLYLAAKSDVNTYYKWVATDNGVLTITISDEAAAAYKSAYVYSVNGEPVERELEASKNINEVKKGDVVIIATYSGNSALEFDVAFAPGQVLDKEESSEKPATNANDKQKYDEIVTGTAKLDTTVVTTLFTVTPDKVGKYTITAPTGVKVEDWNIPSNPMNRTEKATNTVTFNCTAVGQTFLVGITAAESVDKVDVKVEFTAVAQKEDVAWTIYKNTATISKFEAVLSGLEYVKLEDKVVDKAVLGKDGFYHLNSVNGPILYVDLDDEIMSLYGAADLGQLVEYVKENGEVVARYDYNDAVKEYYAAANKDGFYPLTTDLVTILQKVGAYKDWYGENGFLGFTEADAWMFACYYEADAEDGSAEDDSEAVVVVPLPTPEAGKEDEDVIVDKEYLNDHIEQAIADKTPLEIPTTNANVSMTFDPNDLKDADKIELNLTVNVVADAKDEAVAKNDKITDKNFVLKIEFSHEGKLPGEAVISIQLPAAIAEKYEKLFYYQIMADGSLKFVCDAPVVDGVAKVTQDHCSDYVLLTEKVVEVPATGDSTNVAIWFAILALGAVAFAGSVVMRKKEF